MNIVFGKNGFVGSNLRIHGVFPGIEECDLMDYESTYFYLKQLQREKRRIKIVNLAAKVAGAIYNKNHNVEMLYNNALISLNIIRAISELKLDCYYLYLSSVCAYDNSETMEEDKFFNGLPAVNNFGYGIAKKLGVLAIKSLEIDNPNFKSCVLIPTNMYGKFDQCGLEYAHVIPSIFLKMMDKNNKSFKVFGNANNLRNFLYVEDMGKIIEYFVDKEITGTYNVASDSSITILDLVNQIRDITNYKGKIEFGFEDKLDSRTIINNKLKNILPQTWDFTSLNKGLEETYKWIKTMNYDIQSGQPG